MARFHRTSKYLGRTGRRTRKRTGASSLMKKAKYVAKKRQVGFRRQLMKYSENHKNTGGTLYEKRVDDTGVEDALHTVLVAYPIINIGIGIPANSNEVFLKRCRDRIQIYPANGNNYQNDDAGDPANPAVFYSRIRITLARWRTTKNFAQPGYVDIPYINGFWDTTKWDVIKSKSLIFDQNSKQQLSLSLGHTWNKKVKTALTEDLDVVLKDVNMYLIIQQRGNGYQYNAGPPGTVIRNNHLYINWQSELSYADM